MWYLTHNSQITYLYITVKQYAITKANKLVLGHRGFVFIALRVQPGHVIIRSFPPEIFTTDTPWLGRGYKKKSRFVQKIWITFGQQR